MIILVINAGSSSIKYQLFNMDDESIIAKGQCERIGIEGSNVKQNSAKGEIIFKEAIANHTEAMQLIIKALTDPEKGRYGWVLRGAGNAYQQFVQQVAYAAGVDNMLSEAEPYFTKDGTSIWASDAAKKGLEFQLKFMDRSQHFFIIFF